MNVVDIEYRLTGSRRSDLWSMLIVFVASGILSIITANECHSYFTAEHSEVSYIPSLLFGLVMWLWWAVVTLGIWWSARRHPAALTFSPKGVFLHLAAAILLGACHLILLQQTLRVAGRIWQAWGLAYVSMNYESIRRLGVELVIYGFIFGVSGFLHSQAQRRNEQISKVELERQLSQAQLKALQMQLEPHFLFNTLNAIASLVTQGRNQEANRTLSHLNTILRTTLQRQAPEKVPFTQELRVIESYLAIQQVRFADRLQVKIETTPEALEGLVPCFLLQPIIENAIQHGIGPMEAGGLIETCVKRVGDMLWMQVRDNGSGSAGPITKGHGIGMQNTRERLAFFYPDMHEFAAAPLAAGGYEVTIQIPYERTVA